MHQRRRRSEPRRERVAVGGALERGEALLERRPRRVGDPGVVVALVHPDRVLHVRGRLVDRGRHRARRGIRLLSDVDRAGLELHRADATATPCQTPTLRRCGSCGKGDLAVSAPTNVTRRHVRCGEILEIGNAPLTKRCLTDLVGRSLRPRKRETVERLVQARGVAPRAEHPERPGSSGRTPARRARPDGRRRESGARSSRTPASPSARTSPAGSGSRTAPRRDRGRGSGGRTGRGASRDRGRDRPKRSGALPSPPPSVARRAPGTASRHAAARLRAARSSRSPDTSARRDPRAAARRAGRRSRRLLGRGGCRASRPCCGCRTSRATPTSRIESSSSSRESSGPRRSSSLQDVALVAGVLLQELGAAPLPRVLARPSPAHERLHDREILDRPDERVPLEELLLLPEQPIERAAVVRPEPAPGDEVLRRRDARDGIDLEEAEPANGVEQALGRAVEELRADRDPPSFLRRDDLSRPSVGDPRPRRGSRRAVAGRCSRRRRCTRHVLRRPLRRVPLPPAAPPLPPRRCARARRAASRWRRPPRARSGMRPSRAAAPAPTCPTAAIPIPRRPRRTA